MCLKIDPNKISDEENFKMLLNDFLEVFRAENQSKSEKDQRMLDAEALGYKFSNHCLTMYNIYMGVTINDFSVPIKNFQDFSSFNVVGRAAFETFLTLHYVFNDYQNEDEKDFRYLSWTLSGLSERQGFGAQSEWARNILSFEEQIINTVKEKIIKNPYYLGLSDKNKNRVINMRKWRFPHWTEIGESAGLSKSFCDKLYMYLCGYAHSGSLSALQTRQSQSLPSKEALMGGVMGFMKIVISFMIKEYCILFENAQSYYNTKYPDKHSSLAEFWYGVGEMIDSHNQ